MCTEVKNVFNYLWSQSKIFTSFKVHLQQMKIGSCKLFLIYLFVLVFGDIFIAI